MTHPPGASVRRSSRKNPARSAGSRISWAARMSSARSSEASQHFTGTDGTRQEDRVLVTQNARHNFTMPRHAVHGLAPQSIDQPHGGEKQPQNRMAAGSVMSPRFHVSPGMIATGAANGSGITRGTFSGFPRWHRGGSAWAGGWRPSWRGGCSRRCGRGRWFPDRRCRAGRCRCGWCRSR